MDILKRTIFFLYLINTISAFSQVNSEAIDLNLYKHLPELLQKTNIGFYVKGNSQDIKRICNQYKCKYFEKVKNWHYLRIDPTQLEEFINLSEISSYHIPYGHGTPLNDTMRANNRINNIHNGNSPLSSSFSGNGVIIGFIDTGIDFNHGDFKNADGTTRLISLWDQTLSTSSNTPQPYGYGQHWNANGINLGFASAHNDVYGHGSLVAGTAAGNGLASSKHKGIAYDSDIIAVEVDFGANFLANVQDATQYIYHIADSLGMPCVINASAGTYFGSHDGNDPSAQFINNLITSSNSHLFVCSAGNSGGNYIHLQQNSVNNDTVFTLFDKNNNLDYGAYGCVPYCYGDNSVHLIGFADVANFNNVSLAVSAFMGENQSGISSFFTVQDYLAGNYYTDGYGAYVDSILNDNNDRLGMVFMFASLQYGSVYKYEIIISPDSTTNYLWGLHSTGSGKSDIWSDETYISKSKIIRSTDAAFPFSSIPSNYIDPDSLQNMCSSFQCLSSVITVANYVNDSGYVNSLGNWVNEGGVRGEIASSSSTGPTRNGLIKPDIAASGKTTVSSYPDYLLSSKTSAQLGDGGLHYRNGGTSMSSPVVAGIAALYLEKCNQSNYQNFKTDLINSAYTDNFTGSIPNFSFGYGKADGFQTLISTGVNDTILHSDCNSYTWNSVNYDSSGFYSYSTLNSNNCDSTVILDLTINKNENTIDSIFSCNDYTWIDGITYNSNNISATYSLTTINGCDSLVQLNLSIMNSSVQYDTITSCDQFVWHGTNYTLSGNYTDTLININNCDSITRLNLTINTGYYDTLISNTCNDFFWENTTYNSTGIFTNTISNINGCDSVLVLDLTIQNDYNDTNFLSSCDSLLWNNQNLTQSGLYIDSNQTIYGCDSLNFLSLQINNSYSDTLQVSVCDTFFWNNNIYISSGYHSNLFNTTNNCDSNVTINLSVNGSITSPLNLELILDDFCLETNWTVKDSYDSIWQKDGPFNCNPNGGGQQANDTLIADIYLPANECFTFQLNDQYGDGMSASNWGGIDGSWILSDFNGNILSQGSGNFGHSVETNFIVDSVAISNTNSMFKDENNIKASPNPFKNSTLISISNLNGPFIIDVFDLNGRVIQSIETNEKEFYLENNKISKGIYWVKIKNKLLSKPLKIIIQ